MKLSHSFYNSAVYSFLTIATSALVMSCSLNVLDFPSSSSASSSSSSSGSSGSSDESQPASAQDLDVLVKASQDRNERCGNNELNVDLFWLNCQLPVLRKDYVLAKAECLNSLRCSKDSAECNLPLSISYEALARLILTESKRGSECPSMPSVSKHAKELVGTTDAYLSTIEACLLKDCEAISSCLENSMYYFNKEGQCIRPKP